MRRAKPRTHAQWALDATTELQPSGALTEAQSQLGTLTVATLGQGRQLLAHPPVLCLQIVVFHRQILAPTYYRYMTSASRPSGPPGKAVADLSPTWPCLDVPVRVIIAVMKHQDQSNSEMKGFISLTILYKSVTKSAEGRNLLKGRNLEAEAIKGSCLLPCSP